MTKSIVLQLQEDATNAGMRTSDILRKALVVARKLKIKEIDEWIGSELNGYTSVASLPTYREFQATVYAVNPVRGRVAVMFESDRDARIASTVQCTQSVSELEQLCSDAKESNGNLSIRRDDLDRLGANRRVSMPIYMQVSSAALHGVIDAVRNSVLTWALDLEEKGILGDGLSFSASEKEKAQTIHYNITNNIGTGAIAQFSQGDNNVQNVHTTTGIPTEELHRLLTVFEAMRAQNSTAQFEQALIELKSAMNAPKPEKNRIRNALVMLKDAATLAQIGMDMLPKVFEMIGMLT